MTYAAAPTERFVNRTRRAHSIPRKLWAERKPYLIPIYYLLFTSDLAREGIRNSGSYAFADHIYCGKASGRWGVGTLVDRLLLDMPAARAFRTRFIHARESIVRHAVTWPSDEPINVLSVPCGIGRELLQAATSLRRHSPATYARLTCGGVDLDPAPLETTRVQAAACGLRPFRLIVADALDAGNLPEGQTLVTSTGFGEFLADDELFYFYRKCRAALTTGGWLVTSATRRHPLSDYLLRNLGELHTQYREAPELVALLRAAGFDDVRWQQDTLGLQTLAVAVRA
jgi:hypothetical protein